MNKINLLKELKTNELDLRNRVVMAPLTRTRAHNKDLAPSALLLNIMNKELQRD